MSMVTYPLNNVEYTAEDAELFHLTRTSGVYANNSFDYSVSGADNTIIIGTGVAWIKNSEFAGKVIAQKEPITLDLGVSDSNYPRIDAVVIQFDANKNATNIIVKNGTAATNPNPPSVVRTESVYELHLYHVRRNAGSLSISASDITDLRLNVNYCGIMADSVTHVDTDAIEAQISELIKSLKAEIESVEDGSAYWLKTDVIPIENGGTGARTAEEALANLGAVDISELKKLAYSQTDANGAITSALISSYPTAPGVFRVGDNNTSLGIPDSWGTLVIFNGGGFIAHFFLNNSGMWFARTDGTYTVEVWKRVQERLFSYLDGVFSDIDGRIWNPKMEPGVEYPTEEYWNKQKRYAKAMYLGKLSSAGGVVSVPTGLSGDNVRYISVRGFALNGPTTLPMAHGGSGGSVFVENNNVKWASTIDLSAYHGYVVIEYLK